MTVRLKVNKGEGLAIGTLIRKMALSTESSWKVIAFSIGDTGSNILYSNNIVEDMVQFISNISRLEFKGESDSDCVVLDVSFKDELNSSDIQGNGLVCVSPNRVLLKNIIEKETKIKLYLRYTSGVCDVNDNSNFLKSKEEFDLNSVKVIISRHTTLSKFTFGVHASGLHEETIEFVVDNEEGTLDENELVKNVIAKTYIKLGNLLENM